MFNTVVNELEQNELAGRWLNLLDSDIGDEETVEVAAALRKSSCKVNAVTLGRNNVGPVGTKALADALKSTKHIQTIVHLDLGMNKLGNEGAKELSQILLTKGCRLRSLNLGGNGIADEGATAIGHSLKSNQSLVFLKLTLNSIGPQGARGLAAGFTENHSLLSVELGWNNIENEGAKALARSLETNASITKIDLWNNDIGSEGKLYVIDSVEKSVNLLDVKIELGHLNGEADISDPIVNATKRNQTSNEVIVQVLLDRFEHGMVKMSEGVDPEFDGGLPFLDELKQRQGALRMTAASSRYPTELDLFIDAFLDLINFLDTRQQKQSSCIDECFLRAVWKLIIDIHEGQYQEIEDFPYAGVLTGKFQEGKLPLLSEGFLVKTNKMYENYQRLQFSLERSQL